MEHLEGRVALDFPVNIHLTGCPHSCAQHAMGDIGLLGAKVKRHGETVDGYHVFVGGGFGANKALGRQVFTGVPHDELAPLVERMLRVYLRERADNERFQEFTARHDLGRLQELFS
jgi:ferredoxin-nitrite reductase